MSESGASIKTCSSEGDDYTSEVVIVDGWAKFRDGKKWKQRFCVLTKLSPAADCLQLQIYRDEKERARNGHTKASLSLQHFLALESGFTLDKESHTLAIICQDLSVVLAFDNRERLIQWNVRIASNLGEGHQFLVQLASAPTKSKLTAGPVKLHVTDRKFSLTGGIPPRLLGVWDVSHLRRYGIVEGRLVFEGGSRCGKGEGVHILIPDGTQIHMIVDALDMSSKGQLSRMPSRRFGSVADSPRKSMTSRLSEMRNMTILSAESSTNISMSTVISTNTVLSRMSPTPRESHEELCTSCTNGIPLDHPSHANHNHAAFWMSSDSSSRCDLDSVDNISVMNGEPPDLRSPPNRSSPVKNQQINKPLPSAMERCLSCMSKLGAQGQDVLSPSWTMDLPAHIKDLNGISATTMSTSVSQSQVVPKTGSVGSANSDRLSISSNGSCSGVTEYCYDTPRSVLMAEMRRSHARSNTPPIPHNSSSSSGLSFSPLANGSQSDQCFGGGNHHTNCNSHGHPGTVASSSSPQRLSMRSSSTGCGFNGCHSHGQHGNCPNTARIPSGQHQQQGPIYCNTNDSNVCEQQCKSHSGAKTPINLHPPGAYENYDFPRCAPQQQGTTNQVNCCGSQNGSNSSTGQSTCSIDWSKKQPMDRSSIASSAISSEMSEFYDTPRRFNEGVPCSNGCSCGNTSGFQSNSSSSSCCNHHPNTNQGQIRQDQHLYQNSSTCIKNPLENYDIVPPSHNHVINCPANRQPGTTTPTNGRVNGEGRMPLVAGNINSLRATSMPIYAQVDKSKKTQRLMNQCTSSSGSNCDNMQQQQIYQNIQNPSSFPPQPNYMNVEHVKSLPPKKAPLLGGHASYINVQHTETAGLDTPRHPPSSIPGGIMKESVGGQGNYVNMDFSNSLCLYENSKDVRVVQQVVVVEVNLEEQKEQQQQQCAVEIQPQSDLVVEAEAAVNVSDDKSVEQVVDVDDKPEATKESILPVEEKVAEASNNYKSFSNNDGDDGASLPLRRSSSVPCKGGHANRGSASSSDSGVSGDAGLFFEDFGDFGSLCLHESLPRKGQRSSPSASTGGKNTSTTSTPKPQDSIEVEIQEERSTQVTTPVYMNTNPDEKPLGESPTNTTPIDTVNRHYETIEELDTTKVQDLGCATHVMAREVHHHHNMIQRTKKHPLTLVSDTNSTSSGASDMSDYIETLSSCSRGSSDMVNNHHGVLNPTLSLHHNNVSADISASPKRSTSLKPRSGKEYFKIDRNFFNKK